MTGERATSRVGRLAGALLAETEGRWFLVGDLKQPCDFAAAGFGDPGPVDTDARRFRELTPAGAVALAPPTLGLATGGEALAEMLADRMLIRRNASVSERLWRLVLGEDPDDFDAEPAAEHVDARWLEEMPRPVWEIVRDSVLRCL